MLKTIQQFIITIVLVPLAGCQFDLSPWETDVHCPNLGIAENIEKIALLEASKTPGDEFSVAVIGDPQQYPEDLQETIKAINKRNDVDFILLLGDLVETGIEKEYEWSCKALNKSNKPIISVIGNHDALSYGKLIWEKVFGPFDFSFSYLGTKFIAYNDNKYEFDNVPDRDWLKQQAMVEPGELRYHTIGMSHIQPWNHEPNLTDFLKESGFDHMLHAHMHAFDYWQKNGVGLPHFLTADTQDVKYAIMKVTPATIEIEQCEPQCIQVTPRIRY